MQTTQYRLMRGRITLVGSEPDGDSVRFRAAQPGLLTKQEGSSVLRLNREGSLPLRLESIDAPETHYQGASQPLGVRARDRLLRRLGFRHIKFSSPNSLCATSDWGNTLDRELR